MRNINVIVTNELMAIVIFNGTSACGNQITVVFSSLFEYNEENVEIGMLNIHAHWKSISNLYWLSKRENNIPQMFEGKWDTFKLIFTKCQKVEKQIKFLLVQRCVISKQPSK